MKKMSSLDDLFLDELKDIYNAEKQLTKALPKMAKAASTPELKLAFQEHLEQTKGQIDRLEQAFELLGKKAQGKTCKAMEGLVEEGKELMEEEAAPAVMDAALISAAQKVEHYEIGSYGTLATFAKMLGYSEVASLLKQTLDEEKAADSLLTKIAQKSVNWRASDAPESTGGGRSGAKSGSKSKSASK